MSVYVDPLVHVSATKLLRAGQRCHLYADRADELHAMARELGLQRDWFVDAEGFGHYELVTTKRARAIELGAVQHSHEQMLQHKRRRQAESQMDSLFGGLR